MIGSWKILLGSWKVMKFILDKTAGTLLMSNVKSCREAKKTTVIGLHVCTHLYTISGKRRSYLYITFTNSNTLLITLLFGKQHRQITAYY